VNSYLQESCQVLPRSLEIKAVEDGNDPEKEICMISPGTNDTHAQDDHTKKESRRVAVRNSATYNIHSPTHIPTCIPRRRKVYKKKNTHIHAPI